MCLGGGGGGGGVRACCTRSPVCTWSSNPDSIHFQSQTEFQSTNGCGLSQSGLNPDWWAFTFQANLAEWIECGLELQCKRLFFTPILHTPHDRSTDFIPYCNAHNQPMKSLYFQLISYVLRLPLPHAPMYPVVVGVGHHNRGNLIKTLY